VRSSTPGWVPAGFDQPPAQCPCTHSFLVLPVSPAAPGAVRSLACSWRCPSPPRMRRSVSGITWPASAARPAVPPGRGPSIRCPPIARRPTGAAASRRTAPAVPARWPARPGILPRATGPTRGPLTPPKSRSSPISRGFCPGMRATPRMRAPPLRPSGVIRATRPPPGLRSGSPSSNARSAGARSAGRGTRNPTPSRRSGGRVRQPVPAGIWWRRGGRNSAGARRRPPGSCAPARIGQAQAEGAAGGGSVRTRLNSQRPPPKSSSSERIEARLSVACAVNAISVGPSTAANFPSIL